MSRPFYFSDSKARQTSYIHRLRPATVLAASRSSFRAK